MSFSYRPIFVYPLIVLNWHPWSNVLITQQRQKYYHLFTASLTTKWRTMLTVDVKNTWILLISSLWIINFFFQVSHFTIGFPFLIILLSSLTIPKPDLGVYTPIKLFYSPFSIDTVRWVNAGYYTLFFLLYF